MNKEKMIRMVELTGSIRALLAAAINASESTVQKQEMLIGIRLLADMAAETADGLMMEEMNPMQMGVINADVITSGTLSSYDAKIVYEEKSAMKKPYPVGSDEAKQIIERIKEEEKKKKPARPRKETT